MVDNDLKYLQWIFGYKPTYLADPWVPWDSWVVACSE